MAIKIVEIDLEDFEDDELKEEIIARGYAFERKEKEEKDWRDLALFIVTNQTKEALELVEYMSGGEVSAISIMNQARTLRQLRTA